MFLSGTFFLLALYRRLRINNPTNQNSSLFLPPSWTRKNSYKPKKSTYLNANFLLAAAEIPSLPARV